MKKILVLCTGNSCRSQIAHGYLEHFAKGKAEIYSAGVETHGVNPRAIATMKADGIDISHHTSNNVNEYTGIDFDFIITVCDNAKERCPVFPSKAQKFHQNFPDPAKATGSEEQITAEFARVRQIIKEYCEKFVKENL
ncbi:MAG: arsenate reductase ArsC [Turneriella sp.]